MKRRHRLRVTEGNILHHRPSTDGPLHVGWRELHPGTVFRATAAEAESHERNGTAKRVRWWET